MAKVNDVLLRAQDSVELQEPPVGEEKGNPCFPSSTFSRAEI